MTNLLRAMALAALALTVGWLLIHQSRERPEGPAPHPLDPGYLGPPSIAVLSGRRGGVEVLVRRRYAHLERASFTDLSLARALGIPEGRWVFLEVLVHNGSEEAISLKEPGLRLEARGREIPLRTLRQLARRQEHTHLVRALDPDVSRPVEPHRLRRFVVGVPRGTRVAELTGGRVAGVPLVPGRARRQDLEAYLDRPGSQLLAVLDTEGDRGERGR